jgi:hypothetical protein
MKDAQRITDGVYRHRFRIAAGITTHGQGRHLRFTDDEYRWYRTYLALGAFLTEQFGGDTKATRVDLARWTAPAESYEDGWIVIQDRRVVAVVADVEVPALVDACRGATLVVRIGG